MSKNESALSKTQLYQSIISILSNNSLGYTFLKSNYRYYYFTRQAANAAATDLMIITVYFEKGYIACDLKSRVYYPKTEYVSSFSTGILNRNATIFNSRSTSPFGPTVWSYYFQKDIDSLKAALHDLLADLESTGSAFVIDCDNRYSHSKFVKGMEFIKFLTVPKEEIKKLFPTNHYGYWWKLDHEKYTELELLFDEIDRVEQIDKFDGLPPWRNNGTYAFEFFYLYAYGAGKNKKGTR